MELPKEYMYKLAATRVYSDFTFKVDGGGEHKVHKVILAAQSPVFEQFFEKHEQEADIFDLFTPNTPEQFDKYTKLAIREGMVDVFSYCYYKAYDFGKRDASDDFELRVLSHLVAHGLAIHFNIPGLRALTWEHFTTSFWSYAQQCPIEKLTAALNECFSPDFVMQSGFDEQAVASIRIEALAIFKHLIEQYKKSAKFKEVLDLIEAVPLAAAKLYSQPPTQNDDAEEDEDEDDEEEGESEDEDEVLELFNDASKRRKKEQYVTG